MISDKVLIEENVKRHDEVAETYDDRHKEIYNPTEQKRLQKELDQAFSEVKSTSPRILDFGSGTGNLTEKLLPFGKEVWATDVSSRMLDVVARKNPSYVEMEKLKFAQLAGDFPLPFPDNHFAFIATYSVLHHVPDYLEAVRELCRVLDKGGVLYIDHELNENYWHPSIALRVYRGVNAPIYASGRIVARTKAFFGFPEEIQNYDEILEEGDIHVFPDDHIDWDEINSIAIENGLKILPSENYLLCRETSDFPLRHHFFSLFLNDTGIYVGRKE
ncbi:MAG: class I SAM-dependent methyltransferase [Acidobacteriota bacterium]